MSLRPFCDIIRTIPELNLEPVQELILVCFWCSKLRTIIIENAYVFYPQDIQTLALDLSTLEVSRCRTSALAYVQNLLESSVRAHRQIIDLRSLTV